jgi:hypothetical protein
MKPAAKSGLFQALWDFEKVVATQPNTLIISQICQLLTRLAKAP